MFQRIITLSPLSLIGMKTRTSLAQNRTVQLWQSFMPRRKEIKNVTGQDLYSLQVYPASFDFADFSPDTEFEKWAAVAVHSTAEVPEGMEVYALSGGLYAVFLHKGTPQEGEKTFRYIFESWLPASDYQVDNSRAHFELLGEKYRNNDPASEEEIWIPVKQR